jgi:hypothetical protein
VTTATEQPRAWLITTAQRDAARRLQKLGGGVIGPIDVPAFMPASIEPAGALDAITAALEQALDRIGPPSFTSLTPRTISFERLCYTVTHRTDMLHKDAPVEDLAIVTGVALLEVDAASSPPIEFTFDEQTGAATLDDAAEQKARAWIGRLATLESHAPNDASATDDVPGAHA